MRMSNRDLAVQHPAYEFSVSAPRRFRRSFPNSVWERSGAGNSVSVMGAGGAAHSRRHLNTEAKQSLADKCVPKQSLGTRTAGRCGMLNTYPKAFGASEAPLLFRVV